MSTRHLILLQLLALTAMFCVYLVSSSHSSQSFLLDSAQLDDSSFQLYIEKYQKSYSTEEYIYRRQIFIDNTGYIANEPAENLKVEYPTSINWVTAGAVTNVKNQGQCGACWAFSVTGAVEGAWKLSGHPLTSLSEQQLIDCSQNYGCNGGWITIGFQYIISNKGVTSESNYPYQARNEACNQKLASQVSATISSYKNVVPNSVDALATAVAQQPVSVLVDARGPDWQSYGGGIVTDPKCGTDLEQAVLVVGYDMGNSPAYWLVKNSWSTSWGEAGYIRLGVVPGNGICGVQMQPSYPVV